MRVPQSILICFLTVVGLFGLTPPAGAQQPPPAASARDLFVTAGKSLVIDSPVDVARVSLANGDTADAVVVSPREVVVHGKSPGETSLIVWQSGGSRIFFDVKVASGRLEAVQQELSRALEGQNVTIRLEDKTVFLEGTAKNLTSAERAVAIGSTLGKVVNLLYVPVPPTDAQILLKVRFASVDRARSTELGLNLFSTGATNTVGSVQTGQFPSSKMDITGGDTKVTISDALNVFLFRRDLNLGAMIKALQARSLLQILAEPNVLALNGKSASFLAGGEFPYPTLQGGGGGLGAVTIQFREFGVRLTFLPVVTPRGTIRLKVTPEVSALDYANGLVFQGFTIPGLSTRRVQTEIELEQGQSFAIGGLLDNRVTESLSKMPGLGDIPWLGKLFQSKLQKRENSELLVLVTPELVQPIPADQKPPELALPGKFLKDAPTAAPRTPGIETTGPRQAQAAQPAIPVEQLLKSVKPLSTQSEPVPYSIQYVPVPVAPAAPQTGSEAPGPAIGPSPSSGSLDASR